MQENESIYEIARLMENKDYIKNDFMQAFKLMTDFFRNKYIASFENELKAQTEAVTQNPSKEIRLISLLKEFMPENEHGGIDRIINTMTTASAISKIKSNMPLFGFKNNAEKNNIVNAAYADPSVKDDGVYDIDESCKIGAQKGTSSVDMSFALILILFAAVFWENN